MGLEKYVLNGNPMCCAANVVSGEHYRISMLTTALVRLEYSENGEFEDRPTQMVVNRDFAPTEFKVSDVNGELHIYTKDLEIHYDKKEFTPGGLMIRVAGGKSNERVWHYGEAPRDLLGTARTLDEADGAIPLEHGILSKNGFSLIDDSKTMALKSDGTVEPRVGNKKDIYFFGYGHRYLECLKDFYYLCGETPLLPRYTFGNWWSRYHRYTETEYKDLIERFEREEIPFSVAVVDMDWHLVDDVDPIYGSGWTGYTWNKKFFPNPKEFMGWLHEHHMKITLNVHPADGIRAYEDAYERVATKMGMDPEKKEPVLFDVTDPKFMEVYFEDKQNELKERTMKNKRYMMEQHIIPYFGNQMMSEITAGQIIQWQNEMQTKGFSEAYLRMIQNQLTSLFTHASRIYDLHTNPCKKVKRMGSSDNRSLDFWTVDEYQKFIQTMEPGSRYYLIFEILFWTGCRIGELLALTPKDVDFERNQISITKTYYRTERQDVITEPKTKQSVRLIEIPEFLKQEIKDFIDSHYEMPENERLFPIVQEAVQHKMKHQMEKAGVKKIRVHDLRHSHVAYLINKGIEPILIKERVGHKDIRITLNTYGHLYPNQQRKVADMLDFEKEKSPNSGNC